jgi:hypothetical protein
VPEIVVLLPEVGFSVSPLGKVPELINQVYGPEPFDAVQVAE